MGFNKIFPIKNSKYSVMVEYNGSLDDLKKLFFKKIKLYSKKELNFTKNKPIKKVGIIAGSGKIEEILELKKNNIKTIITSDVK
jgi:putative NIF3 family GTP cyclohydrolase 1 type 2